MQTSDSIVIIPTYNERENIENIIRAIFGLEKVFHILIIDDGSPDGTAAIVKSLQTEFPDQLYIGKKRQIRIGYRIYCRVQLGIATSIRLHF
jgi:dolichol-phosphate mannosyltransferase